MLGQDRTSNNSISSFIRRLAFTIFNAFIIMMRLSISVHLNAMPLKEAEIWFRFGF